MSHGWANGWDDLKDGSYRNFEQVKTFTSTDGLLFEDMVNDFLKSNHIKNVDYSYSDGQFVAIITYIKADIPEKKTESRESAADRVFRAEYPFTAQAIAPRGVQGYAQLPARPAVQAIVQPTPQQMFYRPLGAVGTLTAAAFEPGELNAADAYTPEEREWIAREGELLDAAEETIAEQDEEDDD